MREGGRGTDPMLSPDRQSHERAREFLALILPEPGPYAAFIVESGSNRKRIVFASTTEELWEIIKAADIAGHTAYHACAGYKEARYDPRGTPPGQRRYGRTKHNARGAKALWLDVDAGPGKPYADWQAAARAVAEFCRVTGLPRPLVVLSGLGIHVYWPLVQTLDVQSWERHARGLKALCAKHGLHADPTRTADITSVLRAPGTHHRKGGIRLVQCGAFEGPYALEQFAVLLSVASEAYPKDSRTLHEFGPLPPYLVDRPFPGLAETLRRSLATTYKPSFANLIAERCDKYELYATPRAIFRNPFGTLALACWPLRRTARGLHTNGQAVTRVIPRRKRRRAWTGQGGCPAPRPAAVSMNSIPSFVSGANFGGHNEVAHWLGTNAGHC